MSRPLDGVVVVEAASWVSAPLAGLALADLGAEVIKIEPPTGDSWRKWGRPKTTMAPVFASTNRGKRSVVLDLKSEADQARARQLLADADVFLSNWRPDVAARLGLADDVLAAANPRLIRVYVTGYGPTSSLADAPSYDTIMQGRSGMTEAFGDGTTPRAAYGYVIDKVTAMTAAQATLAALLARERTGAGDRVDLAMLDAAAYFNFVDVMANRTLLDHQPDEARYAQPGIARPLPTSDGWIVIAPVTGGDIKRSCIAAGHEEWVDEVFAQPDSIRMVDDLLDRLTAVTPTAPTATWLQRFAEYDIAAGPCLDIDGHLEDEAVKENDVYLVTEWPGLGRVRQVRYPARFNGERLEPSGPAPELGAG